MDFLSSLSFLPLSVAVEDLAGWLRQSAPGRLRVGAHAVAPGPRGCAVAPGPGSVFGGGAGSCNSGPSRLVSAWAAGVINTYVC